jgi:hypothetical protein
MRGVSLLYAPDGGTQTLGGITRRTMSARAWLFELECGLLVWDSLYGLPSVSFDLRQWLEEEGRARFGIISASEARLELKSTSLGEQRVKVLNSEEHDCGKWEGRN